MSLVEPDERENAAFVVRRRRRARPSSVTCSKAVQRRIALLGCGLLAGCAIDSRLGRVQDSPDESAESADPMRGSVNTAASAGAAGSAEMASAMPGQIAPVGGGDGTETGIAPVLPPPDGAAGASGSVSAQGSMGPGAAGSMGAGSPGQGAGGADSAPGMGAPPPPPVTEPEVIGGCFNQLLRNGDFERGREGWRETSELRDVIVWRDHPDLAPTGVTPQAGNYLAWIGGVPNGDFMGYPTRLQQEVQVPAEAQSLTLSGYYWAAQPELGRMPFDWAMLELADPDPESRYLWRLPFEDTVTETWTRFEMTTTDVSWFAGKTVPVQTFSVPNGNGTQSVWLDSLRLEARCPR
jgi:hypothetical protein